MKDIYSVLKELKIDFIDHKHPPVFTCEEADRLCKDVKGAKSKNIFLRNKKGKKHYLIVVSSDKRIDLKSLSERIGESGLSFASEGRLEKYLGCTKGSVSLFGLINDANKEVKVLFDEDLWNAERLHYHPPGDNAASIELSGKDLQKFLKWCGNELDIIAF
jgi:Ala-tRNA(Pro) deacylase